MKILLYPTEARSRDLFRSAFAKVKDVMLDRIDEILAKPAKCAAIMPPNHNFATYEKVRLGAYLTWWRDHGHEPDGRDENEWADFLRYNETFPLHENPMNIREVIKEFDPARNLTRVQFENLAARQPSLEGRWMYRLEQIIATNGISYPEFDIYTRTFMFLNFADARRAAHGGNAYCFRITQLPDGEPEDCTGASWLFDGNGTLVDYCVTTWEKDPFKSCYFGRPKSRQRFRKGDIVEVIGRNKVSLGVIGADMLPVDWFWARYKKCGDLHRYYTDASDDCYYLLDGPGETYHSHISPVALMKHHLPITEDLRIYFKNCVEALNKC